MMICIGFPFMSPAETENSKSDHTTCFSFWIAALSITLQFLAIFAFAWAESHLGLVQF